VVFSILHRHHGVKPVPEPGLGEPHVA
jgi:hypothetical protein